MKEREKSVRMRRDLLCQLGVMGAQREEVRVVREGLRDCLEFLQEREWS